SRKVAAERKMERTRENLLRVQDILRELERQMAALERQARRAEEYHRIKQELRELDLRVMAVRQRSCPAEVAALGERLAALQAEAHVEALAGAGAPLEQAVEESKDALLDALAEEARLRNLAEALRQRRDDLDGRRRRLEDEQRALGERLHANARASEAARAAIGRLAGERARLVAERQTLGELQRTLGAEETAQLAVLEQARAEVTQLRSPPDSLRELQARYEGCTRGAASLVGR